MMSKNSDTPNFSDFIEKEETQKPQSKAIFVCKILRIVFFALTLLFILLMVTKVINELFPVVLSWTGMIVSEMALIQFTKKEKN